MPTIRTDCARRRNIAPASRSPCPYDLGDRMSVITYQRIQSHQFRLQLRMQQNLEKSDRCRWTKQPCLPIHPQSHARCRQSERKHQRRLKRRIRGIIEIECHLVDGLDHKPSDEISKMMDDLCIQTRSCRAARRSSHAQGLRI